MHRSVGRILEEGQGKEGEEGEGGSGQRRVLVVEGWARTCDSLPRYQHELFVSTLGPL